MDIREVLVRLRASGSDREISRDMELSRVTVRRYRHWAKEYGLLQGEMMETGELQRLLDRTLPKLVPPQNESSVEPYRELVVKLRAQKVEMAAIHARLSERGFRGSYDAVWRFVRTLEPKTLDVVMRVETAPGEEAQVDFGDVGFLLSPETGELRRAWAFVMTLSFSRHAYIEFVFDQRVETWLTCHVNALRYFGGVPERMTIDNLKAAITQAAWNDPEVNRSYRDCAEHYGFLIAPCRPRTPQHKGKVESGVHYVQRNFMAGKEPIDLLRANQEVKNWLLKEAGERIHGTTKEAPLTRFNEVELERLRPLPRDEYDIAVFKEVKLHRDCHVVFNGSFYSAPFRMVGQQLWVRAGLKNLKIFDQQHQLIATHELSNQKGYRTTHPDHLPPEKTSGLMRSREECQQKAEGMGKATQQVVQQYLDDPVVYRVPVAGRLLRLSRRYTEERLEVACARALYFGDPSYTTIKRILEKGMDALPLPAAPFLVSSLPASLSPETTEKAMAQTANQATGQATPVAANFDYARAPEEIVGHLQLPEQCSERCSQVSAVLSTDRPSAVEGEIAWT